MLWTSFCAAVLVQGARDAAVTDMELVPRFTKFTLSISSCQIGTIVLPQETCGYVWEHFRFHNRVYITDIYWVVPRDTLNILQYMRQPPQQSIIQAQLLVVLNLKNPPLNSAPEWMTVKYSWEAIPDKVVEDGLELMREIKCQVEEYKL